MKTLLRTSAKTAAAVVLAAATLAGCGGDDDNGGGDTTASTPSTPTERPVAKPTGKGTSTERWVDELCVALNNEVEQLLPPEVSPSSPESTRDSLVAFYDRILDRFEVQEKVLKDAGSPPGSGADKTYENSVKALQSTARQLEKAAEEVRASNPKTAEDVAELMKSLEEKMVSLADYKGPIIELTRNDKLSDAINANETCNQVG